MKLMFGTDPECFIRNKKSGQFVGAEGIIPGTKNRPFKVDRGGIQVDGLAAEFNTDPADNLPDFLRNINAVKAQLTEMVEAVDKDLELVFVPYAEFDKGYFDNLPKSQKILGCDPDYSYSGNANSSPANADHPFRTAAGHIHIGWTEGVAKGDPVHFNDCKHVASHFYYQNLQSFIAEFPRLQRMRLQYYGMYGSFRDKSYGVELRSPDNTWVTTNDNIEKMWRFLNQQMEALGA